jgi:hypothetical protein
MFNAAILLTPYLAIASSLVLAVVIGMICYSQRARTFPARWADKLTGPAGSGRLRLLLKIAELACTGFVDMPNRIPSFRSNSIGQVPCLCADLVHRTCRDRVAVDLVGRSNAFWVENRHCATYLISGGVSAYGGRLRNCFSPALPISR